MIVTPGIRPEGVPVNDQKRSATPTEAVMAGADYLVVGRPITDSADPKASALHDNSGNGYCTNGDSRVTDVVLMAHGAQFPAIVGLAINLWA
jgi:hypothetical protein